MLKTDQEKLSKFITFIFVLEDDDDSDRYHEVRMKRKSRNIFQRLKIFFAEYETPLRIEGIHRINY